MFKSLSIVSALSFFAIAASAASAEDISFTRDGVSYQATIETRADGTQRITGREVTSGIPFRLTLRDTVVTGFYNHQPMNFSAKELRGTQLTSR